MIATKDELFSSQPEKKEVSIKRAKVMSFTDDGRPLIRFEGESATSSKVRQKIRSYDDPRVGDRVLVINDIIIGTWTENA